MKRIILTICLLLSLTAISQTTSRYKPGYTFTFDYKGSDVHVVLLSWMDVNANPLAPAKYEWRISMYGNGVEGKGFTTEEEIDFYTNKCWFDKDKKTYVYYTAHK